MFPALSVADISELLTTENELTDVPPKLTAVAPEKLEPLIVITDPDPPHEDEILVMAGVPETIFKLIGSEVTEQEFLTVREVPVAPDGT